MGDTLKPSCKEETLNTEDKVLSADSKMCELESKTKMQLEENAIISSLDKANKELEKEWYTKWLKMIRNIFLWLDHDNQVQFPIPYYTIMYGDKKLSLPTIRLPMSWSVETKIPRLIEAITDILVKNKTLKGIKPTDIFETNQSIDIYQDSPKKQEAYIFSVFQSFIKSIQENTPFNWEILFVYDTKYD
jgi:hypothetical protein